MRMTPTRVATNNVLCVGRVPADCGTVFFAAREPAMARIGTMIQKRETSMQTPSSVL